MARPEKMKAYPVYIDNHLLSSSEIFQKHIHGHQVFIVTQKNIAELYLGVLQKTLQDYHCDVIFIPEGEKNKNIFEWQKIIEQLILKHHERSTTLIALGGGVIGDMTGFAAACYQRGVNYIQVPTTLMAQVDSSIGGKTGINHPLAKNMLGAFHQPQCVVMDMATLTTLPEREFVSGIAEIIKYGLIWDADFFSWLENNIQLILEKNSAALKYAIERSAAIKMHIVAEDERDHGLRQLLNFGHTFGHALESATNYQTFLHGEAVAFGMKMAAELSHRHQGLSVDDVSRIENLLKRAGLLQNPVEIPDLMSYMKRDKKTQKGETQFILLKKIGSAIRHQNLSS